MKILKYILLLILALIALTLIYVGTYESSYNVNRSKIIKAPLSHAFNTVNDLKTWEKWGPWHDEDSTIVITYGDKTIGIGANTSWTSKKDGPGRMETINLETNTSIQQNIYMVDGKPANIYWNFEEVTDGTKVTWGMKADNTPFFFKLFAALSGGWDKMLGPMQEKGLDNLDKVLIETIPETPKFTLSNISIKELKTQTFIGYPHKIKIDFDEMTRLFMQDLPKAGMYAIKLGLKEGEFIPGAVYTKYDETLNETEFYIGLLLQKDVKPDVGMQTIKLPEGKAVFLSKFGNYGIGDEQAHVSIDNYIINNELEKNSPIWELYVNDPTKVKPEEIQTDIYYPIK